MPYLLLTLIFAKVRNAPVPFFVKPIVKKIAGKVTDDFITPNLMTHLAFLGDHLGTHPWFAGADFSVADTIRLSSTIFNTIVGTGTLTAAQFVANASGTAQDANDRIIYETDTGKLFFDSNGSAAGGAKQFAQLSSGLALAANDFSIV